MRPRIFVPEGRGLGTFQKAGTVQGRCGPGAVRPVGTLTLSGAGHPACPLDHPVWAASEASEWWHPKFTPAPQPRKLGACIWKQAFTAVTKGRPSSALRPGSLLGPTQAEAHGEQMGRGRRDTSHRRRCLGDGVGTGGLLPGARCTSTPGLTGQPGPRPWGLRFPDRQPWSEQRSLGATFSGLGRWSRWLRSPRTSRSSGWEGVAQHEAATGTLVGDTPWVAAQQGSWPQPPAHCPHPHRSAPGLGR